MFKKELHAQCIALLYNNYLFSPVLDQESAIIRSLEFCFSQGGHTPILCFCSKHMKDNILLQMANKKVERKVQKEIFKAVFSGENALVKSEDETTFKALQAELKVQYGGYFKGTYLSVFTEKLYKYCLLPHFNSNGAIPRLSTNNDSECVFSVIKRRVRHERMSLPELVFLIIDWITAQVIDTFAQ